MASRLSKALGDPIWQGLGVILALIVAVGGYFGVSSAGSDDGDQLSVTSSTTAPSSDQQPPLTTQNPTTTTSAAPPATRATSTGGSGVPSEVAERFAGEVLLSEELDFDANPPAFNAPSNSDMFVSYGMVADSEAEVALWEESTAPTAAQCADILTRLSVGGHYEFEDAQPGLAFCLLTDQGRMAYVRLEELVDDGFLLSAVVWEPLT